MTLLLHHKSLMNNSLEDYYENGFTLIKQEANDILWKLLLMQTMQII